METAVIRENLYEYIRLADDKKVQAIYNILESDIGENIAWWENNGLLKELDTDYKKWKNGQQKGYTTNEVNASIDQLRTKMAEKR
jgi:hypothetical protein